MATNHIPPTYNPDVQLTGATAQVIRDAADTVARSIVVNHAHPMYGPNQSVPAHMVPVIAQAITAFTNELLQNWLDAGSERDAVQEGFGPAVEAEVWDWCAWEHGSRPPEGNVNFLYARSEHMLAQEATLKALGGYEKAALALGLCSAVDPIVTTTAEEE